MQPPQDDNKTNEQIEKQIIDAGMGRIRFSTPEEADRCIDRLFSELKSRGRKTSDSEFC